MPDKRPSMKNEKQYEALKRKGMSKERAAKIANSPGASSRGGKKSGSGGNASQGGRRRPRAARGARRRPASARRRTPAGRQPRETRFRSASRLFSIGFSAMRRMYHGYQWVPYEISVRTR
jgi:hypothetical protein